MAENVNTFKDIGNALYKATLIAGGVVTARYATKALGFKDRPVEMKLKSFAMLTADVGGAIFAVKKLQDAGIVPPEIFK